MSIIDSFFLTGKIAIVTGGAGKYGRFIVEALAEQGAKVVIASRDISACQRVATELAEKSYRAIAYRLDLANEGSIRGFVEEVYKDMGRIDVLVNNAVLRPLTGFEDDVIKWQESMQVNAAGVFLLTRLVADKMMERGGSIINIASIQGMVGPDLNLYEGLGMIPVADYFFHRAGIINLTRYFAALYGGHGIRVNSISPGGLLDKQSPLFIERYSTKTYLGRMAHGEDIKGAVAFLASDASQYVSGINLAVDGGYTAC